MFNILNDILFDKHGNKLSNIDDEQDYNMFMINRWISMYSPEACHIINSTTNWLQPVFETKQQHYKFLSSIFPRYRRKFIQYVKKHKHESDNEQEECINLMTKNLELSKREVKYLLEQQKHYER